MTTRVISRPDLTARSAVGHKAIAFQIARDLDHIVAMAAAPRVFLAKPGGAQSGLARRSSLAPACFYRADQLRVATGGNGSRAAATVIANPEILQFLTLA
jgi:hypothetical protein